MRIRSWPRIAAVCRSARSSRRRCHGGGGRGAGGAAAGWRGRPAGGARPASRSRRAGARGRAAGARSPVRESRVGRTRSAAAPAGRGRPRSAATCAAGRSGGAAGTVALGRGLAEVGLQAAAARRWALARGARRGGGGARPLPRRCGSPAAPLRCSSARSASGLVDRGCGRLDLDAGGLQLASSALLATPCSLAISCTRFLLIDYRFYELGVERHRRSAARGRCRGGVSASSQAALRRGVVAEPLPRQR